MALPWPQAIIEWSPTTAPTAPPVWVDISSRLLSGTTGRKVQRTLGIAEAGTAALVLANQDGLVDPLGNPACASERRVRIRAQTATGTFPVFDGFLERVLTHWPELGRSTVTWELVDAFGYLGAQRLVRADYAAAVLADAPDSYFRFNEQPGALFAVDETGHGNKIGSTGSAGTLLHSPGALITDDSPAMDLRDQNTTWGIPGTSGLFGAAFTLECWVRWAGTAPSSPLAFLQQSGVNPVISLRMESNGTLSFEVGGIFNTSTAPVVADGLWHHVVFTRLPDIVTFTLTIDNVERIRQVISGGPVFAAGSTQTSTFFVGTYPTVTPPQIDELALYHGRALTGNQIFTHYWAGRGRWSEVYSDIRVGSTLDTLAWPSTLRDVPRGAVEKAARVDGSLAPSSVLSHLHDVAEAEDGKLYVSRDGLVTFRPRSRRPAPIALTLGEAETPYEAPPAMSLDFQQRVDQVTVKLANGFQYDWPSAPGLRKLALSPSAMWNVGGRARDRAYAKWLQYNTAILMADRAVLHLSVLSDYDRSAVLGCELFVGVEIKRRSPDGRTWDVRAILDGISHTFSPDDWRTTLDLGQRWVPPVPASRSYGPTAQSVPTGAWTQMAADNERYDLDSHVDVGLDPPAFSLHHINTPGWYLITAHLGIANNATGRRGIGIRLNQATYIAQRTEAAVSGYDSNMSVETLYYLFTGDVVEMMGYQNSGGNLVALQGTAFSPEMGIVRLGD